MASSCFSRSARGWNLHSFVHDQSRAARPVAIAYVNTPELVRTVYPWLQMATPMLTHEMKRLGFKVNASRLPSVGAILPHVRPSVYWLARRDDGLLVESRQTIPLGGAAPLAAAVAAPAIWFTARTEHVRAEAREPVLPKTRVDPKEEE